MLSNFLIIGARRAGTMWLAANLRKHPEIFMPKIKEVHFFGWHYDKGLAWYESFFSEVMDEKAVGEASPGYLYTPQVAARCAVHVPNARLIVSLRNPVDRVYSRYWNAKAKYAHNRNLSFEDKIREKPLFIEEGMYYKHLQRFAAYYPRERIKVVFFEDIGNDPLGLLQDIFRYLEVDPAFEPDLADKRFNAAADKPGLARRRWLAYVQKAARRLGLWNTAQTISEKNAAEIPPMNPETRRWLVEEVYREPNEKLAEWLGRDLSHWNR